jgi:S1-C subfamily serine protease
MPIVEAVLLSVARILTCVNSQALTNATGFFFERDNRLFLVTSRHVIVDEPSKHFPNRVEIEVLTDSKNLAESTGFSIPLYQNGKSVWKQVQDSSGTVDVVAIELNREALPDTALIRAFTPANLSEPENRVEVGTPLMVVGFPLGFHDSLHHMPVVRQAVVASSFGLRFQGMGYFLTDARTHRGISGAPVVMRVDDKDSNGDDFHWKLLGVHSARLDVGTRDIEVDEALGLNCAWYADVLMTLTA